MELKKLSVELTICKVVDNTEIKFDEDYCFYSKTDEERSLVCQTKDTPINTVEREDNWEGFRIQGVLDFSMVGVLAKISKILADNKIGIFVISTYNTDYILTKTENFSKALEVLAKEGYKIVD